MHDSKNMILVSLSRLVSELGAVSIRFALSLYILDITGSPLMSGFVFSFTYIPGILINLLAGVLVDRSSKKKALVVTELLSGILTLGFMAIFMIASENIILIICYIIALYSLQAIFMLALNAGIPEMVTKDKVIALNSNIQAASQLVNIFGIIVGASIYITLGLEKIFLIGGICFLLSGTLNMFFVFAHKIKAELSQNKPYMESLKEVYQFIQERKAIKWLLGIFVAINFIIAPMVSNVLLFIIRDRLNMVGYEMAFIEAAFGAGCIIGALLISVRSVSKFLANKIFILIQLTAVTLLLWVFPSIPFISNESKVLMTAIYMILLMFTGIFNAMGSIPMISYMQIYIPENIRASIFGVVTTVTTASVPIGLLSFGAALEVVNWVYLVAFAGLILLTIGFLAHRSQDLREFFKNVNDQEQSVDIETLRPVEGRVMEKV